MNEPCLDSSHLHPYHNLSLHLSYYKASILPYGLTSPFFLVFIQRPFWCWPIFSGLRISSFTHHFSPLPFRHSHSMTTYRWWSLRTWMAPTVQVFGTHTPKDQEPIWIPLPGVEKHQTEHCQLTIENRGSHSSSRSPICPLLAWWI